LSSKSPTAFHVVTACMNAEDWIEETIASVVLQSALTSGRATLEYVIQDGGSTDRTLDRARATLSRLGTLPNVCVTIVSEPDAGLYDALCRGFDGSTADVHSYLNAGDIYASSCFDTVISVMESGVDWLTGWRAIMTASGQLVYTKLPGPYNARLIRSGSYGVGRTFPPIQQEGTFWRRYLHEHVDKDTLVSLRLAGDAYLWATFARHADLHVVNAYLGAFRMHGGHLSDDSTKYEEEFSSVMEPSTLNLRLLRLCYRVVGALPGRLRFALSNGKIVSWSNTSHQFRGIRTKIRRFRS
jgi:glycosyltransferase involved in cell wall biosynthesis